MQSTSDLYGRAIERLRDVPGVLSAAGTNVTFLSSQATRMHVDGWDSLPATATRPGAR